VVSLWRVSRKDLYEIIFSSSAQRNSVQSSALHNENNNPQQQATGDQIGLGGHGAQKGRPEKADGRDDEQD
jgi:hypothetical protein